MILFLCILFVFLMGYGVASNVLIYPHQGFSLESIKNVFYMPYFQIYGNLFLEVLITDGKDFVNFLFVCNSFFLLLLFFVH